MMKAEVVVFLDDGGLMNDNARRGSQRQRLVAGFFAPRLGGEPRAWEEANRVIVNAILDPAAWEERLRAAADYAGFDRTYQIDWLGGMCDLVGALRPPAVAAAALADEANRYIWPRVRAAIPGAVEAIRSLRGRGYCLHTASGECSAMLAAHLEGMGVRDCFDRLYGPDLIGAFKSGPTFYERLLADAGVSPIGVGRIMLRKGADAARIDQALPGSMRGLRCSLPKDCTLRC